MTIDDIVTALEKENTELTNRIFDLEAEKEALIAGQETLQKALAEKNAEIESLIINMNAYGLANKCLFEKLKIAKSEAYKEFAERLKETPSVTNCEYEWLHTDIDNLAKELTEVSNGE
jgi:chromosome segregation ATPase